MDDGRAADPQEWAEAIAAHEALNADSEEGDDGLFRVWPENKQTLVAFLALGNCWRINNWTGQRLSIDRVAIESTLRMMQVRRPRHRTILKELCLMEHAALEIFNREK